MEEEGSFPLAFVFQQYGIFTEGNMLIITDLDIYKLQAGLNLCLFAAEYHC